MALRHAILAALLDGERSGYDLAKVFDASLANFWMAAPQQLYRELDQMETAGLIDTRTVVQQRRPNKRVHSVTDAGRAALGVHRRTGQATVIRDDVLVKVQGMDGADEAAARSAVADGLEWSSAKLARYEALRAAMLAGGAASTPTCRKRTGSAHT